MNVSIAASTNWNLIAGTDVSKVIRTIYRDTKDFVKPKTDDFISTENAILLTSGTDTNQPSCEFSIRVFPKFMIDSLALVCTSSKIELFSGAQCEYVETIYGERMEDEEELDDIDGYRYDVEIQKSAVTNLMLKMITSTNELCIYGIQVMAAPNPNGIAALMPSSINLDNVKEMLNNSNQKLSPSAEKCKLFLESYKNAMSSGMRLLEVGSGDDDFRKEMSDLESKSSNVTLDTTIPSPSSQVLKQYIDRRVQECESRILKRLDEMEEVQNLKLDRILKMIAGGVTTAD